MTRPTLNPTASTPPPRQTSTDRHPNRHRDGHPESPPRPHRDDRPEGLLNTPAEPPQFVDLEPPIATEPQAQGDLLVLPWPAGAAVAARAAALLDGQLVPTAGIELLRGAGGHTHTVLAATGAVAWAPAQPPGGQTLGVLVVPPGGVAVLAHEEHADLHIGPGVYAVRRQRSQPLTHTGPDPEVWLIAD